MLQDGKFKTGINTDWPQPVQAILKKDITIFTIMPVSDL